ncbi:MAG: hypothetical protein HKM87_08815, partial [Ignavibacteriaceae bacterium]|nr:hypothetical protein [Ignavibacteriaceae bacterium]
MNFKVNDPLLAKVKIIVEEVIEKEDPNVNLLEQTIAYQPILKTSPPDFEQNVSGKLLVQSYSNFSNSGSNYSYQRWRYLSKLKADYIGSSGFSYSHYINFAYRADEWNQVSSSIGNALRVYDLAIKYNFSKTASIVLGRHINRKISNISSVDGVQFQKSFSNWSFGLVAGSRPDFTDNMNLNTKLFEYGGYINKFDSIGTGTMENTLAYFEQTNDFKTDRRFIYLQHSNSIIPSARIFFSTEIDLFKKELGISGGDFSLTSFFISTNIRPSNIFSLYLSYDARKNVIYYETFKSFADSIFENETRQGFRARLTLKPIGRLYIGTNYGYRFRPGDVKPSHNYGGYITYSSIPVVDLSSTLSFTKLRTNYVDGNVWGIRIMKPITYGLDLSLLFRHTTYKFSSNIDDLRQQSISANLMITLLRPISINLAYEG